MPVNLSKLSRTRHWVAGSRTAMILRIGMACLAALPLQGVLSGKLRFWQQAPAAWACQQPAWLGIGVRHPLSSGPPVAGQPLFQGSSRRTKPPASVRQALQVNEEEYIEVWDQSIEELSLDVRELLITDGNLWFIGPDIESYHDSIVEVSRLLNYTHETFLYKDLINATEKIGKLETVWSVAPLVSIQRWPWSMMYHGLTIWIDPDGWKKLDIYGRERMRKLKFPKKKRLFGPEKGLQMKITSPSDEPPGDPIDMWMEGDVHVDIQKHPDVPITKLILASIINAILESPPKWRGWLQSAKIRGTVAPNYQTPLQERRAAHSFGVSPRLNRLLKER